MSLITSKQQQAERMFDPLRRNPDAVVKRSIANIDKTVGLILFIQEAEKIGATVHQLGKYYVAFTKGTKLTRRIIIGSGGTPTYA